MKVENQYEAFGRNCIKCFLICLFANCLLTGLFDLLSGLVVMGCAFGLLVCMVGTQAIVPQTDRRNLIFMHCFSGVLFGLSFVSFPYYFLFFVGILLATYLGWILRANDTHYGDL